QKRSPFEGIVTERNADLERAITESMAQHEEKYNKQQKEIGQAVRSLTNSEDVSDEELAKSHQVLQQAPLAPLPQKIAIDTLKDLYPGIPEESLPQVQNKLQREAFASTLGFASTPLSPEIAQYNLQSGESWRALQNLGIQYPGTGRSVPVFKPDIPGVQKGELISGTPGHPGPAQPIQKGQPSNIGLTTVRGTEFGEVDNPARGGYTEAGWNTGAWGANIADKSNPMVALPYSVLNNYGNPKDKDFGSNFNSKYEVHVVDPNTGKVVVASLGDAGPGAKTGAGLDMTWGTREKLGLPVGFSGNISYRVVPKGTAAPEGTTASVQQTA